MVEREVVLQTIKRMYNSGIDDATIKSTLKDIGLTEPEMAALMNEAKGITAEEKPVEKEKPVIDAREEIAAKTAEKIKEHLETEKVERELKATTERVETEEHKERLGEIHKRVEALHEKVGAVPAIPADTVNKINLIDKRIVFLEKELGEIKAATTALQSLLKKILSTNREILGSISKKK